MAVPAPAATPGVINCTASDRAEPVWFRRLVLARFCALPWGVLGRCRARAGRDAETVKITFARNLHMSKK